MLLVLKVFFVKHFTLGKLIEIKKKMNMFRE